MKNRRKDAENDSTLASPNTIGERVREYREKNNEKQAGLAAFLGYDPSVISKIESGKKTLKLEMAAKMADHWGITVDDLMTGISTDLHSKYNEEFSFLLTGPHKAFLSSLGIKAFGVMTTNTVNAATTAKIKPPCVMFENHVYDVPTDKLKEIIEITMESAHSTLEAACRKYGKSRSRRK